MNKNSMLYETASRPQTRVLAADQTAALNGARVVFLTNSMMIGGMEAHLDVLTRGLIARGVLVTVVCPDYPVLQPMHAAFSAAGANVYTVPAAGRSPVGLAKRFLRLISLLRSQAPFVFHLHLTGSDGGTMPLIAAKLAGAKAAIRTEHLPPDAKTSLRRRLLIRIRDRLLDRVVCVSQANLERYVADLGRQPGKLTTIHNAVDPSRFGSNNAGRRVRELVRATEDDIVVGAVSRLSEPRKGIDRFIEIAKTLSTESDALKFFVVGDGRDRAALEIAADGKVAFLGEKPARRLHTDDIDVADCYAAMDIFVQPSLSEGGPVTVLEAMATGLPIVTTDVGMVREAITHGVDGLVVPPGDTASLESAVRAVIQDAGLRLRLGLKARGTVLSRFGEDIMTESTLDLYAEIAGRSAT